MCGGTLELPEGITYAECPYCGSATTFPKLSDDRKESLYNRAEHLRRSNDFEKALQTYEKILEIDDTDSEIYWGLVLCRYGIEYVEDPVSHERIPTCHRVQLESILQDSDYLAAVEHASGNETAYEMEAKKIAEIQKGILAISSQEQPFDVFICYKESTEGGTRTKDSTVAQDIYYQLTNEGYRVFFARITLEDKLGQQYEPYIFAALNSAKVMLVIGSKKEYFEAVWVKNEWSRFLSLMKKDRSKILIPCYKDMDAYDIPEELSMLQSQDMSKIGFIQDLLRGIKKVLSTTSGNGGNKGGETNSTASEIQKLLKKAEVEKELDNSDAVRKIGEQITNLDIDNVEGWYLQACNCNNAERTEKLFQRVIKMKPDRAEYYISAAREISLFIHAQDNLDELDSAHEAYINSNDDDDDNDWNNSNDAFDKCMDDVETLSKCINLLSDVIENKIAGVKFAESDKNEAKDLAVKLLDDIISIMEYLREENCFDTYLKDEYVKEEHDNLAKWILLKSAYTQEGVTREVFFNALNTGNLTLVEKYLDGGGDVNGKDEIEYTPLGVAVLGGFDQIVKYLVDRGADVNSPSGEEQSTPLHLILSRKSGENPDIIKFLLEHGADPNIEDANGDTPLSLAFNLEKIMISPESLDLLIQAGADPNYTTGDYTPLIQVAQDPDKHELVRILLEGGADFMLASRTCGGTAMDYARGSENISFLTQVECPRVLNFDPIKYDEDLAEQQRLSDLKEDAPFQIKEFTLGSYIYSEIDGVIRPLGFMSDDDKADCPLGASMKVLNTSNKTIKYIHLHLQPLNDVDDPMADITTFTFTGPLAPGKKQDFRIESLNFDNEYCTVLCSTISDILVCGADVDFMDGSSQEVSGEAILLEKANLSGAQIANGLLEAGKLAKGIFDLFS